MCGCDARTLDEPSRPVCSEVLKAEYVQQADGQVGGSGFAAQLLVDGAVDVPNDPYKQLVVDCLIEDKFSFKSSATSNKRAANKAK